jgi:hypothetical protein
MAAATAAAPHKYYMYATNPTASPAPKSRNARIYHRDAAATNVVQKENQFNQVVGNNLM